MTTNLVALFNSGAAVAVPAYLRATADSVTSQIGGGMGSGRNRIGLKGARFRLVQAGQEIAVKDEPYLDVVILGANVAINRTFYAGTYDPSVKTPPACFSVDGISPAKDSVEPQSSKCATCPQNEKGSKVFEGRKARACAFSKRLAVMLSGDPEREVYQLDVKALSLFGDGIDAKGLYTLSGYAKFLAARGVRAEGLVTRLSFDTASSVPKMYFTPQSFIAEEEFAAVAKLAKSAEVKSMLEVNASTVDLSGEVSMEDDGGFSTPAAAPALAAPAPTAEPVAEVVKAAPKAVPKKAEPKPEPKPEPVAAEPMGEDLEAMLDGLI
jgi:hypothetical protein